MISRKDCMPEETISKIKKILRENHIKIKEGDMINLNNNFFSVRLELYNIPRYRNEWERNFQRICLSKRLCRIYGKVTKWFSNKTLLS